MQVSTFIEDVGSDEDVSSSPKVVVEDEEETKKLNFKLETSDLDFLEQISTSTPEPGASYPTGFAMIGRFFNTIKFFDY